MTAPQPRSPLSPIGLIGRVGVLSLLVFAGGCGASKSPVDFEPSEEQEVVFRISDTQDVRLVPERYRALFVEGSAPNDELLRQHQQYGFSGESAQIEGDRAVATVIVRDLATGEEQGTVQWKLQRVDGTWMISDAPLP